MFETEQPQSIGFGTSANRKSLEPRNQKDSNFQPNQDRNFRGTVYLNYAIVDLLCKLQLIIVNRNLGICVTKSP